MISSLTHSDVNKCDKKGRSALHLVASSENIHARKMVSLLMKSGTAVGEEGGREKREGKGERRGERGEKEGKREGGKLEGECTTGQKH